MPSGAEGESGLDVLRSTYSGNLARFEALLGAARLYLAGRYELRQGCRRRTDLAVGTRLGDFEILEPLNHGGMGEVYRARQLSLGSREVTLEVLSRELRSSAARRCFQREALLLAGLHHPGLSEVFGFGEAQSEWFLAMRLAEGIDLRTLRQEWRRAGVRIRDHRERIVAWGEQVAEALAYVHAAGLVHRDVKPSNIVIEGVRGAGEEHRGRAVLVDFGLVRPVDSQTLTLKSGSPATLEYAPPEQILDSRSPLPPMSSPWA